MGRKKELTIYLGLRWFRASFEQVCKNTETILEKIIEINYDKILPLNWNIPVNPYLETKNKTLSGLITEIKARINRRGDFIIPMGYSGAPHVLLPLPELEKELEWCIKNSFNSGIIHVFGQSPDVIIPSIPDTNRAEALKLYKTKGFKLMGIPCRISRQTDYELGPFNLSKDIDLFSYLFFYKELPLVKLSLKSLKHASQKNLKLFLLFDITCPEIELIFEQIIRNLEKQFHIRFSTIDKDETQGFAPDFDFENSSLIELFFNTPWTRVYWHSSNILRSKHKKTHADFKKILTIMSTDNKEVLKKYARKQSVKTGNNRIFTANMPGLVTLLGYTFDAIFSGGRLCQFCRGKQELLPAIPAYSYIKMPNQTYFYKSENSFSFEDENLRGLRNVLKLKMADPPNETTIVHDYYFIDDFPLLIISSEITYPELSLIPEIEIVPFAIPMANLNREEKIIINSLYGDGTQYCTSLGIFDTDKILYGGLFDFEVNNNHIFFGFIPNKNSAIQSIKCNITRQKKNLLVTAYIFRTNLYPQKNHSGNPKEVFSFFMGIKDHIPHAIPYFPRKVLKNIPTSQLTI